MKFILEQDGNTLINAAHVRQIYRYNDYQDGTFCIEAFNTDDTESIIYFGTEEKHRDILWEELVDFLKGDGDMFDTQTLSRMLEAGE